MRKDSWTKKRHAHVFAFLRVAMAPFFRIKYNYKAIPAPIKKGPCLIINNHQATMDPFFVAKSFRFPIYFFASDDLFNLKASPIINYLVRPIPKSKSLSDLNAVRTSLKVFKEGGAVSIAPEGNRTLSGRLWEMNDSIAKLAKLSKVPLVIYNLRGGYGTDPRWGRSVRKGTKYTGSVQRIIYPEEYAKMSVAELFEAIKSGLDVDDTQSGERYKSRRRAEYIERALYICPVCGKVGSIHSKGARFECTECGMNAEYTEDLRISPPVCSYERIYEWYEWERREIAERVYNGEKISDDGIQFFESVKFKKKVKLGGSAVSMDRENLYITGGGRNYVYPLRDIFAVTAVGKKKFNFYCGGKTLQVKGGPRFCSVKYVHIFEGLKNIAENGADAQDAADGNKQNNGEEVGK